MVLTQVEEVHQYNTYISQAVNELYSRETAVPPYIIYSHCVCMPVSAFDILALYKFDYYYYYYYYVHL